LFYLIYTDVKSCGPHAVQDTPNYLVTAADVCGDCRAVYLNASGFDPSLFHDDDGRKWLVNLVVDHRPSRTGLAGS
jgi:xylan 1,4-beta-xylosidase